MYFFQFLFYLSLLRYVLQQLIVFAVVMMVAVKADCQSFTAMDFVVIPAAVIVV
jgi:hypothetical protein